jgi:DNA polymerase-3 subunit alpha
MGKKDKAKMAKLRTKFIDGTVERGIAKSTAEALFDGIAKFAEYGFNRAHSAAYGVIAYQTAYLKANYPLEYMTALLIHMEGSADRVATAIVDCRIRNIDVLAPHPVRSGRDQERGTARGREHRLTARCGRSVQVARGLVRSHGGDPGCQQARAGVTGAVGRLRLSR